MTSREPSNYVVHRLVAAINDGDRDAFLAALTPDATLTDDGNPRPLRDWIDREIFTVDRKLVEVAGHLYVEAPKCRKFRATIYPVRTPQGYPLAAGSPPGSSRPAPSRTPVPTRSSSAAIRLVSRRPPSAGRPGRGRSASPASPSSLNRPIQRRTVAGWQSSSSAIWDGANPCSDSSTITARAACRQRPCNSARSCSISLPGALANTLTGRILTTTSPGG
jgi:hypothetical protein